MSKYVLFGTNSVARHLIRTCKLQFLCPIPDSRYKSAERRPEYDALKRLGAQPIQYNFIKSGTTTTAGFVALLQIIKGTKGVIWAIDPPEEERAIRSNYRGQCEKYLRKFEIVLSAMSMGNGRPFLSLIPPEKQLPLDNGRFLASYMKEAVERHQTLKWAFVRTPENSFSKLVERTQSHNETKGSNDFVATTMKRVLEMEEFNGTVFELDTRLEPKSSVEHLKSDTGHEVAPPLARHDKETHTALTPRSVAAMQAFLDESVTDFKAAIRGTASARSSTPAKSMTPVERFIDSCRALFKSGDNGLPLQPSPNPLHSLYPSAEAIVWSVAETLKRGNSDIHLHPIQFPHQFSPASVQAASYSNMTQLLEAIRESRSHPDIDQENQQKRDQHILRRREILRLEAFKKGLQAPNADVLVWRRDSRPSSLHLGFKRAAISIHGDAGIPYIPPAKRESARQVASVPNQSNLRKPTVTRRRTRHVLETLNDVLADKSAGLLSSHLTMPLPSVEMGEGSGYSQSLVSHSRYKGTTVNGRG